MHKRARRFQGIALFLCMPRLVLTGGSGFLGRFVSSFFARKGWQVTLISRSKPDFDARFVEWDGETFGDWARELDGADALINLAGQSVNCRYNAENKRLIRESRTRTTGLVARAIQEATNPPRVWLNASSATFYRHALDRAMDEKSGEKGSGFSVEVVEAWENALFAPTLPSTRRVALRLAMVFGPDKGGVYDAFASLAKMGFGGPMAGGAQFISWIHVRDFARACLFLIENETLEGAVNICSPNPRTNAQFLSDLRRSLNFPFALPTAKWQLELGALLMGTETELLLKSRRVVPKKLTDAGFTFDFPRWINAARNISREM